VEALWVPHSGNPATPPLFAIAALIGTHSTSRPREISMETDQNQWIVTSYFTRHFIGIKANQLCSRSDFSPTDLEDLEQSMRLHLLRKAHLYDPKRGRMEAFVKKVLSNWVAMQLRHLKRRNRRKPSRTVSLERTSVRCEGNITTLGSILLEEDGRRLSQTECLSSLEQYELHEAIEHAMGNLQPEDRAIAIYVADHRILSASRKFGISRRQIKKAMDRVRHQFEKSGLEKD